MDDQLNLSRSSRLCRSALLFMNSTKMHQRSLFFEPLCDLLSLSNFWLNEVMDVKRRVFS